MGSLSSVSGITPRFGHGNSGRHKSMLEGDYRREYRRIKQHNPNDPRVKGVSEDQFVAKKAAGRGKKDWRK